MEDKILNIPSMSMFNDNWELLLKFMENEGNPPFHIEGDLWIPGSDIKSIGNLTSVGGGLNLMSSNIESLANLKSVGGYLELSHSFITSLSNLEYVGGNLLLIGTPIEDIGKLKTVRGDFIMGRQTTFERNEIKKLINLGGDFYRV